jgi:hypothetical protein
MARTTKRYLTVLLFLKIPMRRGIIPKQARERRSLQDFNCTPHGSYWDTSCIESVERAHDERFVTT